jgi:hypothetical protein
VLPALAVDFEDVEGPSGVVRRGPRPVNYREELVRWFDLSAGEVPPLKALGTSDASPSPARIPFLIF